MKENMTEEVACVESEARNLKKELRKKIMQLRDQVDEQERNNMNARIFHNLTGCSYYKAANTLFIFVNYISEVDTKAIIRAAIADGKTIYVPKVKSKEEGLVLYRILSLDDLELGYHGILEPKDSCQRMDAQELDLIIMPGVAFDLSGGRIGYGGGFYDRFIRGMKKDVMKLAIAYELQLIENIPMDAHDEHIDGIITEDRIEILTKDFK